MQQILPYKGRSVTSVTRHDNICFEISCNPAANSIIIIYYATTVEIHCMVGRDIKLFYVSSLGSFSCTCSDHNLDLQINKLSNMCNCAFRGANHTSS